MIRALLLQATHCIRKSKYSSHSVRLEANSLVQQLLSLFKSYKCSTFKKEIKVLATAKMKSTTLKHNANVKICYLFATTLEQMSRSLKQFV